MFADKTLRTDTGLQSVHKPFHTHAPSYTSSAICQDCHLVANHPRLLFQSTAFVDFSRYLQFGFELKLKNNEAFLKKNFSPPSQFETVYKGRTWKVKPGQVNSALIYRKMASKAESVTLWLKPLCWATLCLWRVSQSQPKSTHSVFCFAKTDSKELPFQFLLGFLSLFFRRQNRNTKLN